MRSAARATTSSIPQRLYVLKEYEVDIVVDQEDYIYDGTAKLLSQETDRVHIGFLDG